MSSDARGPLARNKRAGEIVERSVARRIDGLGLVPDEVADHYDAITTTRVDPTPDCPFVGLCLLERGQPVEIKSVMSRYSDGSRGRFYLRPEQHEWLSDRRGVYLFAVCEPTPDRDVLALKVVPAATVGDFLADRWFDGGAGRSDYAQLAWSRLFREEAVNGGGST